MEIEIISDEPSLYTITINGSIVIQTTLAVDGYGRHRHQRTADDSAVSEWVREVRKVYGRKKKKAQNLAIGLHAEHSANYRYGNFAYPTSTAKDGPYEIIQICVGNHCLIYEPSRDRSICKALRELLSDNNVIVFGVGMDLIAKKIEKDFGVKLSKPWDLRKLAECAEDLKQGYYGKYSLEKLALVVLGKERELVKPARIHWYNRDWNIYFVRSLSDEKIKYGTVDAFLAYEMGMHFLEKGTIEAFPAYEKLQKDLRWR